MFGTYQRTSKLVGFIKRVDTGAELAYNFFMTDSAKDARIERITAVVAHDSFLSPKAKA
jgi:hypothetical protein